MLRAALRPVARTVLVRAVHTSRPVAGPSRIAAWAPTVAVCVIGAGIFGWQISRSGRVVSLDTHEPAASPKAPSDEEIAEEIIHEKAEEAEETLEESDKEAAFDPVTGEINWDCPCLGGMAHGPCGQQFRDAFSCFVYSNEEPKGINCVEKFRAMQDCFREHPDVYGEEIMGDDDEREDADAPAPALAASDVSSETPATILTDPRVVTVDELSATDVPPLPNAHPPASSPVLQTDSRTTGRRF